jgi:hypothetical protein
VTSSVAPWTVALVRGVTSPESTHRGIGLHHPLGDCVGDIFGHTASNSDVHSTWERGECIYPARYGKTQLSHNRIDMSITDTSLLGDLRQCYGLVPDAPSLSPIMS